MRGVCVWGGRVWGVGTVSHRVVSNVYKNFGGARRVRSARRVMLRY